MRDYNDEFARVSTHLGHVTFSLVLTLQCLVFVVGVLAVAASVARSAVFLLLCAVDPAAARQLHHHAADYVVLTVARVELIETCVPATQRQFRHQTEDAQCTDPVLDDNNLSPWRWPQTPSASASASALALASNTFGLGLGVQLHWP